MLKSEMNQAAANFEFEKAQALKEKLLALEGYQSKSTIVSSGIESVDVFTAEIENGIAFFNYLVIYNGAIIHAYSSEVNCYHEETLEEVSEKIIPSLRSLYSSKSKEILVEAELRLNNEEYIYFVPQRGDKKQLIELSKKNIFFYRQEKRKREFLKTPEKQFEEILDQVQKDLKLKEKGLHNGYWIIASRKDFKPIEIEVKKDNDTIKKKLADDYDIRKYYACVQRRAVVSDTSILAWY
jgi:excinuclease ABC subunit C